jgi:hypothetical protein
MMLPTQFAQLVDGPPAGVADALDLVAGVDGGLVHGFARIDEARSAPMAALGGAFAGTPLAGRLAEATEKIMAGSITDEHLAALAGGRAALLGAVHDALLDRLGTALGRTRTAWTASPTGESSATGANLRAGSRSWLRELAIAGWHGVDHDLVSASGQLVAGVLAEPSLRRLGVLLDGLAAELRASSPVAAMARVPARRWADLWTRALLLSQNADPTEPAFDVVSGRLLVLGVEMHEHVTAAQVLVHGVLETTGGPPRLVRTGVAVAKVDTIVGPAVWQMCRDFPTLLAALAGHRALDVTDAPLLAGGHLLWREEQAQLAEPADPFVTARVLLAGAVAAPVPPRDRHPVGIAEPVLVDGYRVATGDSGACTLDLGGTPLAVDTARLPASGPLTREAVLASSACLGLLRWDDGGWSLQPLAVERTVKRKTVSVHNGDWASGVTDAKAAKATAAARDAVTVLRERAGRLLRK